MQRARAREGLLLACAFVFCACRKHESIATTQTAPAETVSTASPPRPSASSPPSDVIASASASASATPRALTSAELAAARRQAALREMAEFGMLGFAGDDGGLGLFAPPDAGGGIGTSRVHLAAPSVLVRTTQVSGSLPAEAVTNIVRSRKNAFQNCYEDGLKSNPTLQGRVTTQFVINQEGNVTVSRDSGSDLPDASVVQCVVRAYGRIAFPKPQGGGIATVVSPVMFSLH